MRPDQPFSTSTRRYFGTDGVRGVAGTEPMTATFALRLGVAAAESLKASGVARPKLVVGTDTRRSGPMLMHALAAGLTSRGADVTLAGVIPTPGVSYLTRHLGADAGVVVSASHNPFEDNGIKFFGAAGEKLSDEAEARIEARLDEIHDENGVGLESVTGAAIGTSHRHKRQGNEYAEFLLRNAPYLDGLRVGLDCANGSSYLTAPEVFKKLGARLDVINARPDGDNINVESGSTHPQALQARVVAAGLDVGVTFDGDADRALLVDRRGRLVTGDHMLAICAVVRGEKRVVATLMSNGGTEHYLREQGVALLRTQVGDRYVFEALRREGLTLGGEQSGHLLFLDKAPTGDGLLSALQTLAAVRKSGRSLEAWVDSIPVYPQTLLNVRVTPQTKAQLAEHEEVQAALREAETRLGEGRINLRPSGTEALVRVMVEGPDRERVETIAKEVAAVIERVAGAEKSVV